MFSRRFSKCVLCLARISTSIANQYYSVQWWVPNLFTMPGSPILFSVCFELFETSTNPLNLVICHCRLIHTLRRANNHRYWYVCCSMRHSNLTIHQVPIWLPLSRAIDRSYGKSHPSGAKIKCQQARSFSYSFFPARSTSLLYVGLRY